LIEQIPFIIAFMGKILPERLFLHFYQIYADCC